MVGPKHQSAKAKIEPVGHCKCAAVAEQLLLLLLELTAHHQLMRRIGR